jgi:hypothetical protein
MPSPTSQAIEPVPDQRTDPVLYRLLIAGLVAAVLITIAGIIALAVLGSAVPEGLVAIGSACAGGLVGLLVPSPA